MYGKEMSLRIIKNSSKKFKKREKKTGEDKGVISSALKNN